MQNTTTPHPLARAIAAAAIVAAAIIASQASGCGKGSVSTPAIPSNTLCKLAALTALPQDLEAVAARDVLELVRRVKACDVETPDAGDAGAP